MFEIGKRDCDEAVTVWDGRKGLRHALERAHQIPGRAEVGIAVVETGFVRSVKDLRPPPNGTGRAAMVEQTDARDPSHLGIKYPEGLGTSAREKMARQIARQAIVLVRPGPEPWEQRLTPEGDVFLKKYG